MDILKLYEKEKLINSYFKKKYNYEDEDIFNKQVLQLICELSELAYETKCFKYWKNDTQSSAEVTILEFADCLMITLCFCDLGNIDISDIKAFNDTDMVKIFIKLNKLASSITINLEENILKDILAYLLNIANILGYTKEELELFCHQKMDRTLSRINGE